MISMFIKLLKNTEEYFISLHHVFFFLLYIKQVGAVLLNSNFLLYNLFPVINNYADSLRHRNIVSSKDVLLISQILYFIEMRAIEKGLIGLRICCHPFRIIAWVTGRQVN